MVVSVYNDFNDTVIKTPELANVATALKISSGANERIWCLYSLSYFAWRTYLAHSFTLSWKTPIWVQLLAELPHISLESINTSSSFTIMPPAALLWKYALTYGTCPLPFQPSDEHYYIITHISVYRGNEPQCEFCPPHPNSPNHHRDSHHVNSQGRPRGS